MTVQHDFAFLKIHIPGECDTKLTRIFANICPFLFRDPYEMRHVYVKNSQIPFAGEGLWAKTDIKVTCFRKVLRSLSSKLGSP